MFARLGHGIEHMVVARESDAEDLSLLEGMILQTLNRYHSVLNGADELIALGLKPVLEAETLPWVTPHHEGKTKAFEFEVDDTVCLYSRGSAAGRDRQGDNGFSYILGVLLRRYRPANIYVATFSRLVRSQYFASELFQILVDYHITLHDGSGEPIKCWTPHGAMRWNMLVTFTELERQAILARTFLGQLAEFRRKKWIQNYASIPFGYELDCDGRLRVKESAQEVVRKAIRLLGTPGISFPEISRAMASVGVSTPVDGSGWGFDETWQWDGTTYVLERNRPRAEGTDDGVRDARSRGGSHHGTLTDQDEVSEAPVGGFVLDHDPEVEAEPEAEAEAEAEGLSDPATATGRDPLAGVDKHESSPADTTQRRGMLLDERTDLSAPIRRFVRYLDLWETGRMTLKVKSPLDVTNYAEFTVIRDLGPENPYGYLLLEYEPGVPDGGWATPEEFADVKANLERRAGQQVGRRLNSLSRLPMLGPISSWTENGWTYALKSRRGARAEQDVYKLMRQEDRPTRQLNGYPAPPTWLDGKKLKAGTETIAIVGASDLHRTIAAAAVAALRQPVALHADPYNAPTFMGGTQAARRRTLTREIADLEDAATGFYELATASDAPDNRRDFLLGLAQERLDEATAKRAQRDDLQVFDPTTFPDVLTVAPDVLTRALAGLANSDTPVPRETANSLAEVLTDFRMTRAGAYAEFTFNLVLPAEDGLIRVGPVTGRVPQSNGGRRRPEHSSMDPVLLQALTDSRAETVAELLMTTDAPITDAVRTDSGQTGAHEYTQAIRYLQTKGIAPHCARAAIAAVPLSVRKTIWAFIHRQDPDPEYDPRWVELIHRTYLRPDSPIGTKRSNWLHDNQTQYAVLQHLIEVRRETRREFMAWAAYAGAGEHALTYIRRGDSRPPNKAPVGVADPTYTAKDGRRPISLIECRHCDDGNTADLWARVWENPAAVLCRTCVRNADADSPRYPDDYLNVSIPAANHRVAISNPSYRQTHAGYVVAHNILPNIREWADANDGWAGTGVINKIVVDDYYQAIAEGRVHDPAAIRDWATSQNIAHNPRGPIPKALLDEFTFAALGRRIEVVQAWAEANGRFVADNKFRRRQAILAYGEWQRDVNSGTGHPGP